MSNSQCGPYKNTLQMVACCPGLGSLEKMLRQGFPYTWYIKDVLLGKTGQGVGEATWGEKDSMKACNLGQTSPKASFSLILQGRSGV